MKTPSTHFAAEHAVGARRIDEQRVGAQVVGVARRVRTVLVEHQVEPGHVAAGRRRAAHAGPLMASNWFSFSTPMPLRPWPLRQTMLLTTDPPGDAASGVADLDAPLAVARRGCC